mmetsp:Transcript_8804/g.16844  ORF Transcript_8804/g.16844 Transcript_8804/m.16844 type:complete len:161 (+) Transcript_8804:35-517(+)|eukprot:CAMPEP_0175140892 /NCGR_PEP_ID=MMETSP0087-20121206/11774_1 /TAXON_ID=136419 /ORGANISM="Unknown Unknown, Strain D1" /LENGTH=160 /DNA_ID=CAMNT_0016424191 /DNA_START=35 /DNA_END=517 /DNA_ORIENTATION=+
MTLRGLSSSLFTAARLQSQRAVAPGLATPFRAFSTKNPWDDNPKPSHKIFLFLQSKGPCTRKQIYDGLQENFRSVAHLTTCLQQLKRCNKIGSKPNRDKSLKRPRYEYYVRRDKHSKPILARYDHFARMKEVTLQRKEESKKPKNSWGVPSVNYVSHLFG